VVNISRTPAFIYKWFALPKMRKYDFPTLLERQTTETRLFPFRQNHVTLLFLNEFALGKTVFAESSAEIQTATESL